jgi:DNA-binding MarR family transcriptional regulator
MRTHPAPRVTQVADQLHSAAIHLLRRVRRADVESGISPARLSVLSVLVFGGPQTLGTLARAEQVSAPTMTRMIDGLEREGLAKRASDPHDGRVTWIRASAKGERLLQQGKQRRVEELAASLVGLKPTELATVAGAALLLERLFGRER